MEKNEKLAAGLAMAKAICRQRASEKVAVGIDMGTSTCTVGVYQNGQVEVIINEGDTDTGPVFYPATEEDGQALQELAESQKLHTCPRTVVCDLMKLVGRDYYERGTPCDMRKLPFKVSIVGGQPALEVMCRRTDRRFTPVEISSKILQKVKEVAECFLGKPVNIAVITVPVYFNEHERQATKDAATNAGFSVTRLMTEPVAAAVAYGFPQQEGRKYALMYDLGGGTLDVSVLSIANGSVDLKAASGNTHLGGKDFDAALVGHVAEEIESKHGIQVIENRSTMDKLRVLCEQAKRCLSKYQTAVIRLDVDGKSYKSTISRTKFEELNGDLFKSTLEAVEDALDDANIPKQCIDQIVLVGGSTKIPKIQSLLKQFFDGRELTQAENPERAVAFGAAIEAAMVAKEETEKTAEVVYGDLAPVPIGIKTAGGVMAVLVPKNTELPCSCTQYISTYEDNQPSALIEIYQGEKKMAIHNSHLGDLELRGLPRSPRGVPKIEVTICVDKSGIIIATAQEMSTGVKNAVMITRNYDRLSRAGVDNMIKGPGPSQLMDVANRRAPPAQNVLEPCCLDLGGSSDPYAVDDHCKVVIGKAKEVLKWLDNNNPRPTKEETKCCHEGMEKSCANALAQLFRNRGCTLPEDGVCKVVGSGSLPMIRCSSATTKKS